MKKVFFIYSFFIFALVMGAIYYWQKEMVNIYSLSEQIELVDRDGSVDVAKKLPLAANADYKKPAEGEIIKFPIFNYHHIRPMPSESAPINDRSFTVSPEIFEAHLKYFKENGYQPVLASDLVKYFDMGKPLPLKAVAISFDDGRSGQYQAFQLLKKYGFKATFFITTDWVGGKDFLSWEQIKEISEAGMEIGSHSLSHPHLAELSDAQLKKEIEESKKILEEKIGKKIDLIAYPGGNYNNRVIEAVKTVGYSGAFGVYKIIDQSPKYRYSIRRFHADDNMESVVGKLVGY